MWYLGVVVVTGLIIFVIAKHPLKYPHVPLCVHDNHIVHGICKLKWITFGVTRPFFYHPSGFEIFPHQIVIKFYEKGLITTPKHGKYDYTHDYICNRNYHS
jgi:hypothetical protein